MRLICEKYDSHRFKLKSDSVLRFLAIVSITLFSSLSLADGGVLFDDRQVIGLYEPNNAKPVDFDNPSPVQEVEQPSDKLVFNVGSLSLFGDSRVVTLRSDNGNGVPDSYTLERSESWLFAAAIKGEDHLITEDKVSISVDTTGLGSGSYVGVVTARADGFEESSVTVNLTIPYVSEVITDWEMADVRIADLSIPIDAENSRVFYSIGPGYSSRLPFSARLTYNGAAGYSIGFNQGVVSANESLISFAKVSYASKMSIELYKDNELIKSYQLIFSNLPIVAMKAESIVDEPDRPGIFQLISGENGLSTYFYNMGIEYRGGTAQRYSKKPYKIEFVDSPDLETADGLNVQFQTLRNDDDWILDAAFRDTTFVRNLVSMDIWNEMRGFAYLDENGDSKGQPALRGGLVEVILNNQYQGLHVFQETLDRKLLGLKKGTESVLFKGVSSLATLEYLKTVRTDFEQKYPKLSDIDKYPALEELIAFINDSTDEQFISEIGNRVDIDNMVDYWLLSVVTMATDNLRKNYFIYRNDNAKYFIAPWDFDATFGMHWFGGEFPDHEFWRSDNKLIGRLNAVSPEFNNKLNARWNELKKSVFSLNNLSGRFEHYLSQLVPIENDAANAFERNKTRWPDSGVEGRDNPELGRIEWLRDWMSDRLEFVDKKLNGDI